MNPQPFLFPATNCLLCFVWFSHYPPGLSLAASMALGVDSEGQVGRDEIIRRCSQSPLCWTQKRCCLDPAEFLLPFSHTQLGIKMMLPQFHSPPSSLLIQMTLSFYKFMCPCRIRMTVYWKCSVDNALSSEDCFFKKSSSHLSGIYVWFPQGANLCLLMPPRPGLSELLDVLSLLLAWTLGWRSGKVGFTLRMAVFQHSIWV